MNLRNHTNHTRISYILMLVVIGLSNSTKEEVWDYVFDVKQNRPHIGRRTANIDQLAFPPACSGFDIASLDFFLGDP